METSKSRFVKTVVLAVVIVGGLWILLNRDQIERPGDLIGLIGKQVSGQASSQEALPKPQPVIQSNPIKQISHPNRSPSYVANVIRVASFKLNPRGVRSELELDRVADICRRYDAIAIQQVPIDEPGWLNRLIQRMNSIEINGSPIAGQPATSNEPNYQFVSDLGRTGDSRTFSAIIFNRSTLEMDQSQWYTVNDPDNVLSREPIVGWFRTRGPNLNEAFTFTLVNLELDNARPEMELRRIGDLFRAIRDDGRGEDDVILMGDFGTGDRGLGPVAKRMGLKWVVTNKSTTTRHGRQNMNIIFSSIATTEHTGRGDVFDFMRHYNLRLADAVSVSEHLPVWAEFSIFEGDASIAPNANASNRSGSQRVANRKWWSWP